MVIPPSTKQPNDKTLYEVLKAKNRTTVMNTTLNPQVTIDSNKKTSILNLPTTKPKPKPKLDDKKLNTLTNGNMRREIVIRKWDEKIDKNPIEKIQNEFAQLITPCKLKEPIINTALEDEKDNVLMDSINAPQLSKIETQETSQQWFKCTSIRSRSPFSDVVDKRVSEYLGNRSYMSAKHNGKPKLKLRYNKWYQP